MDLCVPTEVSILLFERFHETCSFTIGIWGMLNHCGGDRICLERSLHLLPAITSCIKHHSFTGQLHLRAACNTQLSWCKKQQFYSLIDPGVCLQPKGESLIKRTCNWRSSMLSDGWSIPPSSVDLHTKKTLGGNDQQSLSLDELFKMLSLKKFRADTSTLWEENSVIKPINMPKWINSKNIRTTCDFR